MTEKETATYKRFALSQRIEHILLLISFGMLCLTGLPQKFVDAGWAQWILNALGGIGVARVIHHFFAIMLAFEFLYHVIVIVYELIFVRPRHTDMVPGIQDGKDIVETVRYLVGRRKDEPKAGRYDFRQKIEYWAMMWGLVVMGLTGFLLMFAVGATRGLPGILVPAAKIAHGYEAILAFLAIVTWHFYNAHLSRHVFPLDTTVFTGKISRKRMLAEHAREYEREMALAEAKAEKPAEMASAKPAEKEAR